MERVEEHGQSLPNNVLTHLCSSWIQNPELEYFQWGLLLDIALGVGLLSDAPAQDSFIRLLSTIIL